MWLIVIILILTTPAAAASEKRREAWQLEVERLIQKTPGYELIANRARCAFIDYELFAPKVVGVTVRNKCTSSPSGLIANYWIDLDELFVYEDVDRERRIHTKRLEQERVRLLKRRR